MKLMFGKNNSLQLRLFILTIISIIIIITDGLLNAFVKIRTYIDMAISPIYIFSSHSYYVMDNIIKTIISNHQILLENHILRQELILKNSEQLLINHLKYENDRLRRLLGAPLQQNKKKIITKVLSIKTYPYTNQLLIDKGLDNGVYIGQPVLDDKGIIGQVISANKFTSRVLMICDHTHALPIKVLRNDIRIIISGNGYFEELELKHLPIDIDIRIGDKLVTSGLGNRFPEGYPVAIVSSIKIDNKRACSIIKARPTANLQNLNFLLLIWN